MVVQSAHLQKVRKEMSASLNCSQSKIVKPANVTAKKIFPSSGKGGEMSKTPSIFPVVTIICDLLLCECEREYDSR